MADALFVSGGVTSAQEARVDSSGLLALQGPGALDVRTGVLVAPGSTALITGTSDTGQMTVQIGTHVAVTSRGSANGPYIGPTLEAALKVNIAAAPGTGSRIDVVYVKQQDGTSGVPSPDVTTAPLYGVLQGTSSTGTPTKPNLSTIVGAEELGTVTVAAGATSTNGAGVTITNTARLTTTRGGVILCRNRAERVALTAFPTMQAIELDNVYRLWHDGTRWRYEGDRVLVASTAARDALDAYTGLKAIDPTGTEYIYTGTAWRLGLPVAFLRATAAQGGLAAGWAALNMNVADIDTHAGWSATPNPTRWTCPTGQGGTYAVEGAATVTGPAAGSNINAQIRKNGVALPASWGTAFGTAAVGAAGAGTGRKLTSLVPGDYVELWGFYGAGTWQTYYDTTIAPSLSIERIR